MSVAIKSNNVATVSLGTQKMLGKTAQSEFEAYKARVLADGGVIKDEERTLKAFNLLFSSGMYGHMNSAVSGTFGVKTNASGGITKLYAIDGTDLVGVTYGSGTLPTLDASNNISFAANDPAQNVNGGMFTTQSKVICSKVGNFGYSVSVKDFGDTTSSRRLAGLTKHNDVPNTAIIAQLETITSGDVVMQVQADPLNLTTSGSIQGVGVRVVGYSYPMASFLTVPEVSQRFGSRSGVQILSLPGKTFTQISIEDFYIDFGGTFQSNTKYFSKATVRDFFCFNQATREQSTLLSSFV